MEQDFSPAGFKWTVLYLDPFFVAASLDDPVDVDARYVDVLFGEGADVHHLLHLHRDTEIERDERRLHLENVTSPSRSEVRYGGRAVLKEITSAHRGVKIRRKSDSHQQFCGLISRIFLSFRLLDDIKR